MTDFSFYWHDYETFGVDPARDRPSQFAGVRTDANFNVIGEPLVIYCKPASDMLPHPEACLITGITPQHALQHGVSEAEFIGLIHREFSQPGTCAVGYNSIRFDDEVSRYTLYRNFYDPYAREWQNGNSRWDIIDMVRACRALRPEGLEWPNHEDGTPSFKLEQLTVANGISHDAAHDALSDVYATIAIAKLIKEKQPKLYDYLFQLRDKNKVAELLNTIEKTPVLHTSAMFPATRFCTSLVMPLARHPTNKNGIIAYDLNFDPTDLIDLSADEIRNRMFTSSAELPENVSRIPLKTIHTNRCPVVVTSKLLDETVAQKISLDLPSARKYYKRLKEETALSEKLTEVFLNTEFPAQHDPDVMLYSGGFFGKNDKEVMSTIRSSTASELRDRSFHFEDKRLPEMLFRYRARNFPDSLTDEEALLWDEFRYRRLTEPEEGANIVMDTLLEKIEEYFASDELPDKDREVLQQLLLYTDVLLG